MNYEKDVCNMDLSRIRLQNGKLKLEGKEVDDCQMR